MSAEQKKFKKKCSFIDCLNNKRDNPTLHFFTFPKDVKRQEKWVVNSGNNELLLLDDKQLQNKLLCESHFAEDSFVNANHKRLIKSAVPMSYCQKNKRLLSEGENVVPTKKIRTYLPANRKLELPVEEDDTTSNPSEHGGNNSDFEYLNKVTDFPFKNTIAEMKTHHKSKINGLSMKIKRLKAKISKCNYFYKKQQSIEDTPIAVKTFINMQLIKKTRKWNTQEKQLALSIYYKSPATYKFMREKLKFRLPCLTTIKSWLSLYNLSTGVNTKAYTNLGNKVKTMEDNEKESVLVFDEMAIKKSLEYNARYDFIEGFEDLGPSLRTTKIAKQALVFMLRGLISTWKTPISFYFTANGVTAHELTQLILENLKKCSEIGLNVRAIVSDQASSNRSAYKALKSHADCPFFMFNNKKVFTIFDVPHLIKSVRNTLMKSDIHTNGGVVSWSDIKKLYNVDATRSIRSCVKLTTAHIYPNTFEKMRVKYATQVFSRAVGTALQTVLKTKEFESDTIAATSDFILKLNNLFDVLNSNTVSNINPYKRPLYSKNVTVLSTLKSSIEWMKTWKVRLVDIIIFYL